MAGKGSLGNLWTLRSEFDAMVPLGRDHRFFVNHFSAFGLRLRYCPQVVLFSNSDHWPPQPLSLPAVESSIPVRRDARGSAESVDVTLVHRKS
jgi:hypothetical protein